MSSNSPDAVLYDKDGNALSVQDGVAIPSSTPALMIAGSDGSNSRYITLNSSGQQVIVGAGTAGSPSGGVISIQGVPSGIVIPVSGTLTGFSSTIDSNNSTTSTLGSNATFTGTGVDVSNYASISIQIFTDKDSATDGLQLQWSQNNTNWDESLNFTISASVAQSYIVGPHARYFRVVYTNGSVSQTVMRLQVILHPILVKHNTVRISDPPDGQQDASLVKAVITGKTTAGGGSYIDVKVNPSGTIVADVSNSTNVGITGTVTANIGSTNGLALDNTLTKLTIAQSTALGSNTQILIGGSVSTSSPTYTNGNINPLSLTTSGALRIDGSGVTQPVNQIKSTTTSTSSVSSSASNVTLLSSNSNRLGATFWNDANVTLYLKLGSTATTTDFTAKLYPGGYYETPYNYTGRIDGIWDTSPTGSARITELS